MKAKTKINKIRSIQFQMHENAVLLQHEYDPALLRTYVKMWFVPDVEHEQMHVLMRIKYLYQLNSDQEIELFSHTGDTAFDVFDGFSETFQVHKKGFRITRETYDGLMRFFIVTAIGINRGMIAVKASNSLIDNHPYKLVNLTDFLKFVERTNPTMEIVDSFTKQKKLATKKK